MVRLRTLWLSAGHFGDVVNRHATEPDRTRNAFASALQDYCRAGDSLWTLEHVRWLYPGAAPVDNLFVADRAFNRVAPVVDTLAAQYGYQGCGALSRTPFNGRIDAPGA